MLDKVGNERELISQFPVHETPWLFSLNSIKFMWNNKFNYFGNVKKKRKKKQRHHFADKSLYSQSYGFSRIYGGDSWSIKKAYCQRIDAFKLWYWRRLLRVPWTARRTHQSILKESTIKYSLGGLMLKLKLQFFGHLMWRTDSLERPWCWERLKAEGEGDDRGWEGCMASSTQWTWVWENSGR